jgi:hypothetical protein
MFNRSSFNNKAFNKSENLADKFSYAGSLNVVFISSTSYEYVSGSQEYSYNGNLNVVLNISSAYKFNKVFKYIGNLDVIFDLDSVYVFEVVHGEYVYVGNLNVFLNLNSNCVFIKAYKYTSNLNVVFNLNSDFVFAFPKVLGSVSISFIPNSEYSFVSSKVVLESKARKVIKKKKSKYVSIFVELKGTKVVNNEKNVNVACDKFSYVQNKLKIKVDSYCTVNYQYNFSSAKFLERVYGGFLVAEKSSSINNILVLNGNKVNNRINKYWLDGIKYKDVFSNNLVLVDKVDTNNCSLVLKASKLQNQKRNLSLVGKRDIVSLLESLDLMDDEILV